MKWEFSNKVLLQECTSIGSYDGMELAVPENDDERQDIIRALVSSLSRSSKAGSSKVLRHGNSSWIGKQTAARVGET